MLAFAQELSDGGAGLRVLYLGGGDVDTSTPVGAMMFTVMSALAEMEHKIKRERIVDSVRKPRAAGKDLGGPSRRNNDSQTRNAPRLVQSDEPAAQVVRDLECPEQPSTGDPGH